VNTDPTTAYNPYDFANPVEDASLFVGRREELSEINYYLDHARTAPRPIHVAILGKRASGKTSLLNMARTSAGKKGFCVARLNLNESDAQGTATFLFRLYDAILTAAVEAGLYGGVRSQPYATYLCIVNGQDVSAGLDSAAFPLVFPRQYAMMMKGGIAGAQVSEAIYARDLENIAKGLGKPIVLLIDEGGVLARSRVQLQYARNILMGISSYMLILVGTPELMVTIDDVFSPIARQFKKVHVANFTSVEETESLIRRPLEKIGVSPRDLFNFSSQRDIREIHELSGGRPYEIQLICHTMFRRVQEKRASRMALGYSVLEEVRAELETSQDVTARPILTVVKSMGPQQLEAFGIITDCLGKATLDQLAAVRHITYGDWTADALSAHLGVFAAASLVSRRDDGTIEFLGDDFDRIYIKYLARNAEVLCEFRDLSVVDYVFLQIRRTLNIFDEVAIHVSTREAQSLLPSFERIFLSMSDPTDEEDLFLTRTRAAEQVYWATVEYQGEPNVPALSLGIQLGSLEATSLWFFSSPAVAARACELVAAVGEMAIRAEKLGFTWTVAQHSFGVASDAVVSAKLLVTENARARGDIAEGHVLRMSEAFLAERADRALHHARLAYFLRESIPPKASTNVGYFFLSRGELDKAELLLERDRSTQQPPTYPALPLYDLAILRLLQNNYQAALECIDLSIAALQAARAESVVCQSLFLPILEDGRVRTTEIRHQGADLVRIVAISRETVQLALSRSRSDEPLATDHGD
jgi:hypothetical protein